MCDFSLKLNIKIPIKRICSRVFVTNFGQTSRIIQAFPLQARNQKFLIHFWGRFMELGHFDKHFVKNSRKRCTAVKSLKTSRCHKTTF